MRVGLDVVCMYVAGGFPSVVPASCALIIGHFSRDRHGSGMYWAGVFAKWYPGCVIWALKSPVRIHFSLAVMAVSMMRRIAFTKGMCCWGDPPGMPYTMIKCVCSRPWVILRCSSRPSSSSIFCIWVVGRAATMIAALRCVLSCVMMVFGYPARCHACFMSM